MPDIDTAKGDFVATLRQIRGGDCVFEACQKLEKVVEAVRDTGKDGSLTLKLKIKPLSKGAEHQLTIKDEIELKAPEPDKGLTVMFATDDNQLQREDPRQGDFRDVEESFKGKSNR